MSYHTKAYGGHFSSQKIAHKVFSSSFNWTMVFKDSYAFCRACTQCQMLGSLSRRNKMPMTPILTIEIFDCWGINFIGPFPLSDRNEYILLVVEYVSKWVEAILTQKNDHKAIISFLKENILSRFRTPEAIISD